jgi:hypothetical protein
MNTLMSLKIQKETIQLEIRTAIKMTMMIFSSGSQRRESVLKRKSFMKMYIKILGFKIFVPSFHILILYMEETCKTML